MKNIGMIAATKTYDPTAYIFFKKRYYYICPSYIFVLLIFITLLFLLSIISKNLVI